MLLESPCAHVDTKKPIEVATEFENSANRTVGRNGLLAGENLYPVENFGPFTLPVYQRCQIFFSFALHANSVMLDDRTATDTEGPR